MNCDQFDPRDYAELLMIVGSYRGKHRHPWRDPATKDVYEAGARNSEEGRARFASDRREMRTRTVEYFLHCENCPYDETRFQEHIRDKYNLEEIAIIKDGEIVVAESLDNLFGT